MPRILFYDFNYPELQKDSDYPVGGATVQLHSWIKGFVHEGWDVGVLVSKNAQQSNDSSVIFVETYDQNYGIPKLRYLYYRIPKIFSAIKEFKPDYLYHGLPSFMSAILLVICRLLEIKFILRISNDFILDDRIKSKYSKLEMLALRYILRKSDYVIVQNKYQLKIIQNISHKGQLTLIPNPYYYEYKKREIDRENYVAWIGIFQYQKNLKALYDIASFLNNIEFQIAGSSYINIDDETRNAIIKLKKCSNVKFVGYLHRNEIPNFLAKAKLLLNTSRYEGFSNTYLEAFSVGTPIVCIEKVDPDNIIKNNSLGFSCSSYNDIPNAIVKIFNDTEYDNYSARIKKFLNDNHNYILTCQRLISFLEKFGSNDFF
jgi:glycosyltransferase involved in cell wall biosynthesis